MTGEMEGNLEESGNHSMTIVGVLCFTHKWRMAKAHDVVRVHAKDNLFQNKYDAEMLQNEVCNDIWSDMSRTGNGTKKIASNGQVWLRQTAHENGCPWNKMTCARATEGGHSERLRYAH